MSNGGQQRSSIFNGLLLILLGILLFLYRFHPEFDISHLFHRYWPVLLIVWGIAKLVDHFTAQRSGQARAPILTGGEAALLFLLVVVLLAMSATDWIHKKHPNIEIGPDLFSRRFSKSTEIPSKVIPARAHVSIQAGWGNISIHGAEGNELRVNANESAAGSSESAAHERMNSVKVVIEATNDGYSVHPVNQEGASGNVGVDLDIQLPKTASVTANSSRGDVSISGVAGNVSAATQSGDVEIHDAGSNATADLAKGDARITDVRGSVRITGRGNEIEVTDVAGDATLEGEFYGPIRVRNVTKTTHYTSQKSDLTLLHLTGRLELDSGEIDISDVSGAAKINTHNKDLDVENVAGRLDISDTHGDVKVSYAQPPREEINITNDSGEVDVTLPAKSNFEVSAVSRSGEIQSDFEDASPKDADDKETARLNAKVGAHGPKITIVTSYGTIYLRKSS